MSSEDKKKLQKSYFDVLGLCCSSEVPVIENILKPLEGVKEVTVIVATRTVIVVHDNCLTSQFQIVKALNQARLEANVRLQGEGNYKKKWPSPFAVGSGVLLALSLLKYAYHPLRWLALGAVIVGIFPVALKAIAAIRAVRLDINILVIISVIGTAAMNDFVEAAAIVFLFTIADWLESRASHKANAIMSSLMNIAPRKAVIAETGEVVDADEVKLNTVLAVKAGEVIPIDGIVVDGNCEVDEKTLTGESLPVAKQRDSTVWAGTINVNGYISVKTTAVAEDCVVAKMAKVVEEAQNKKSRTQRLIDRCAKYYTPAVLVISTSLAVVPLALRVHNHKHWFYFALVVLVSSCPCALILSTPVATFCALSKAAKSGLLIKGGDYLEILAKIKTMAFDKTGTITRGEFVVTDFRAVRDDISVNELLYWVSSIEGKSSHPMAAALIDYGSSLSVLSSPESVEDFQNFPGGVYGRIEGKDIFIGNRKLAARAGCGTVSSIEDEDKSGMTVAYIFYDGTIAGSFSLSDACRSGVSEAIKDLKSLGVKSAMLTGDNHAAAMHVQEQLGKALEEIHAELLPEDKAEIINGFKKAGLTGMIGDGINDAPALATADIGISMGISGSALATETGHVILMSNDIRKVPQAIRLARKANWKVIQNIAMSITTKAAILALAIAGHPLVWAAVLADVGTCVLVILNSMLLLRGIDHHGGKRIKSSAGHHDHSHGCKTGKGHSSHHRHNHDHHHDHGHEDHKHSCPQTKSHHDHGHHVRKHVCSKKKTVEVCIPQNCASECQSGHSQGQLSGKNKRLVSAEMHDGSPGNNHRNKEKHCHGRCETPSVNLDCHSEHTNGCSEPHNLSSCTEDEFSNLAERHGCCAESDAHCQTKLHLRSTTLHEDGMNHNHLHSQHSDPLGGGDESHCACLDHDVHSGSPSKGKDAVASHSTIDIVVSTGHIGSASTQEGRGDSNGCCLKESPEWAALHACRSLEKREMGGCCKSYMRECCHKHGHFGPGFGGGLSEIVTE